MGEKVLEARGVTYAYRSGWTLGPLNLRSSPGITALVGPNGAGKTTLLRVLCGLRTPGAGSVVFQGAELSSRGAWSDYRREVGFLPQHSTWLGSWTVADFLGYIASNYAIPAKSRGRAIDEALAATGTSELDLRRMGSLSGGQAQRIYLAAALIHHPQILILDEPTVGLDPAERIRFRSLLARIAEERVVILSTHLMDDVALAADRVGLIDDGRLVWEGTPAQLEEAGQDAGRGVSRAEAGYVALLAQLSHDDD